MMRGLKSAITSVLLPLMVFGLSSSPAEQILIVPLGNAHEISTSELDQTFLTINTQNATGSHMKNPFELPSLLIEIAPSFLCEYVVIKIFCDNLSIQNWSITDNEGKLIFITNTVLKEGEEIIVTQNKTLIESVYPSKKIMEIGKEVLKASGRFQLADTGDEVLLLDAYGNIIDAIIYGDSHYQDQGWAGEPVNTCGKREVLVRNNGLQDTNTSRDWKCSSPGRSSFIPFQCDANIEPFTSPEHARIRIIRELQFSVESVKIALYMMDDPLIISELRNCLERGVNVSILLEGQPVGGLSSEARNYISYLSKAGAEIHLLFSVDGYKRYRFLHCKYAVLDSRRVLIMSDNWVTEGLDKNRGWGVVIENRSIAAYFSTVFEEDFRLSSLDILDASEFLGKEIDELDDHPKTVDEGFRSIDDISKLEKIQVFRGEIQPLISPDFTIPLLINLIKNARSRILVEQFSCELSWLQNSEIIYALKDAALRGVHVRILLDASWFNYVIPGNHALIIEKLNEFANSSYCDFEARALSPYHGFTVLHNKGMVVDDYVVVSSMNWVNNSFFDNREVGAIIESKEVADFFAKIFWEDWNIDPYPPVIVTNGAYLNITAGVYLIMDASNSHDNSWIDKYLWDLNMDGSIEWQGAKWPVAFEPGRHLILLTVIDAYGNSANVTILVNATIPENHIFADWILKIIVAVFSCGSLLAICKKIKRNR